MNEQIKGSGASTPTPADLPSASPTYVAALEADNLRLRGALELIAASRRPDGTYNRCREACEELARDALSQPPSTDALREFGVKVAKSVDLMSSDKWLESIVREVMEGK